MLLLCCSSTASSPGSHCPECRRLQSEALLASHSYSGSNQEYLDKKRFGELLNVQLHNAYMHNAYAWKANQSNYTIPDWELLYWREKICSWSHSIANKTAKKPTRFFFFFWSNVPLQAFLIQMHEWLMPALLSSVPCHSYILLGFLVLPFVHICIL